MVCENIIENVTFFKESQFPWIICLWRANHDRGNGQELASVRIRKEKERDEQNLKNLV